MNRTQRRQQERANKSASKTPQHLDSQTRRALQAVDKEIMARARAEAKEEAITEAFLLMIGIPIKILKEKHGLSDEILQTIAEDITDEYEKIAQGDTTFEEYQRLVWDVCGIRIEKTG